MNFGFWISEFGFLGDRRSEMEDGGIGKWKVKSGNKSLRTQRLSGKKLFTAEALSLLR